PAITFSTLSESQDVRKYFAKDSSSAFNKVSSGFIKRIAQSISLGRSDISLDDSVSADSEPGFLDPPESSPEDQTRKEQTRQAKIAINSLGPGFRYGYDPYQEPTIKYLDPEKYGGLLVRNLIKIGFDPERLPQPFYVQAQEFKGWMDLANRMVPEVDGCQPAREPLFKLDDIAESSGRLCSELITDPRLNSDPLCAEEAPYDKILEIGPSARIDGVIRVRIYLVDVFIRGTPSFVMFGMTEENYDDLLPSYVANRIKNGLAEDGRLFNGRASDTYYFRFLEQAYNTVKRKIDSNLLDPEVDLTEREREARNIIETEISNFYEQNSGKMAALSSAAISGQTFMKRWMSTPASKSALGLGYGSSSFSKKKALAQKNAAFNEILDRTEQQALVFVERYIREEFESMKKIYQSNIPASVDNIDHLFLLSDAWIRGGVFGDGPYDVQSDPSNPDTHNITSGLPASVQDRISELEQVPGNLATIVSDVYSEASRDWPFVLERYIRIEEKQTPPNDISDRADNLYGVVNIEDWHEFVINKKTEGLSGDISEFWGEPAATGQTTKIENHVHTYEIDENGDGVTSTHVDESGFEHFHNIVGGVIQREKLNTDDNGHKHEIEVTGWKFGLRLSYIIEDDKASIFQEAFNQISPDKVMNEKSYRLETTDSNGETKTRLVIPVAHAELPIPDQEFNQFDPETYDVYCLIKELIKTVEYRTWFRYLFPLKRFTSLITIYIVEGFFASLGSSGYPVDGGDMWEVPGGRKSIGPTFRKWARGETDVFTDSRESARDSFNVLYDTAASIDFNSENNHNFRSQSDNLRDRLMVAARQKNKQKPL
ncbi:MAG: hypothetical protein ACXADH_18100, partial [Candidatus Kariarchaeaceae archaeon]